MVKYEKRAYETIRVGTLEYYRGLEGHHGDHLDGRVQGVVFEADADQPVTQAEILAISAGSLRIDARDGITFGKGGRYQDDKSRRCNNLYMYCCSMEFGVFPDRKRMMHFSASDFFVIDGPQNFQNFVSGELWKEGRTREGLRLDHKIHYLRWHMAPVRYRSRRMARIELPLNILDFLVYQKDPAFSIEQEYRFSWIFFDKKTNMPVDVAANPIDLPSPKTWGTAYVQFGT